MSATMSTEKALTPKGKRRQLRRDLQNELQNMPNLKTARVVIHENSVANGGPRLEVRTPITLGDDVKAGLETRASGLRMGITFLIT